MMEDRGQREEKPEAQRANDPLAWHTLSTRTAFANRWVAVELDRVALPNGSAYEYTRLVPRAPGVGVIGFADPAPSEQEQMGDAANVLLEREYRHGVGRVIWQVPGGLADAGEDLREAGLRELREETGYAPAVVDERTVRALGSVWDNPAFGPMQSHLYAAWGLEKVTETRRDPEELVTLHWVSIRWLKQAVRSGEIQDRVVIAAVAQLMVRGWI